MKLCAHGHAAGCPVGCNELSRGEEAVVKALNAIEDEIRMLKNAVVDLTDAVKDLPHDAT